MNIFVVSGFDCGDSVLYEGQNYNTVQIGDQCWFAENLNVGTMLASVSTEPNTGDTNIEKWCYDNSNAICNSEGGLYLWDEAMSVGAGSHGICPSGWHIPSDNEWKTLEMALGMTQEQADAEGWRGTIEGTALKVSGSSGFAGILGGFRLTNESFLGRWTTSYFWSSTESGVSAWYRNLYSTLTTVYRKVNSDEAYGFSVRCLKDIITPPIYSNFTSAETTNFSEVTLASVTSMTLAIDNKGKIAFPLGHSINAENEDYDTNIVIEDEFISVDTAALDSTFNSSATITLEGVTCPVATITYKEGTFTSKEDIIAGGRNCELDGVCSNKQCNGGVLTFDVEHFTGFAAGSNANLTTEAEAGVFYPLDPIEFTAEYINSTDGIPISGECNITFDDEGTWHTMDFNSTDYNYTKSFATAGLHEYNVTCSSVNFVTLEANDTKLVSSVDIPEFSIITLGLGLIAVLGGLFVMRKKRC